MKLVLGWRPFILRLLALTPLDLSHFFSIYALLVFGLTPSGCLRNAAEIVQNARGREHGWEKVRSLWTASDTVRWSFCSGQCSVLNLCVLIQRYQNEWETWSYFPWNGSKEEEEEEKKWKVVGIGRKLGAKNWVENGECIAHFCLILAWPKKN